MSSPWRIRRKGADPMSFRTNASWLPGQSSPTDSPIQTKLSNGPQQQRRKTNSDSSNQLMRRNVNGSKASSNQKNKDKIPLLEVDENDECVESSAHMDETEQRWSSIENTVDEAEIASVIRSIKDITSYDFADLVKVLERERSMKKKTNEMDISVDEEEFSIDGPPEDEEPESPRPELQPQNTSPVSVAEYPYHSAQDASIENSEPSKWNPLRRRRNQPRRRDEDEDEDDDIGLLSRSSRPEPNKAKLFGKEQKAKGRRKLKPFGFNNKWDDQHTRYAPTKFERAAGKWQVVLDSPAGSHDLEEDVSLMERDCQPEYSPMVEAREQFLCGGCGTPVEKGVTTFNFDVWGTGASADYDEEESTVQTNDHDEDDVEPAEAGNGLHVLGIIAPENLFQEDEDIDTEIRSNDKGHDEIFRANTQERKIGDSLDVSGAESHCVDDNEEWSVVEENPKRTTGPDDWGCRVGFSISELLSSYSAGLCSPMNPEKRDDRPAGPLQEEKAKDNRCGPLLDSATTLDSNPASSIRQEDGVHGQTGSFNAGVILDNQPETIDFSPNSGEPPAIRRFRGTRDGPTFLPAHETYESFHGTIPVTPSRSEVSGLSTISQPFVRADVWRPSPRGNRRANFSPARQDPQMVPPSSLRMQGKPPPSPNRVYREV